jgi:RES domain-containing protein
VNNSLFDADSLRRIAPRTVKGRWYRTVKDKYRKQVSSPVGSSLVDGRYHTAKEDWVLYLSESPALSMNESARLFRTVPFKESAWFTATFVVNLSRVLDLTDANVLGQLGLAPADLVQTGPGGYKLTQRIATAARSACFEAIMAPSARSGVSGNNLVVFLEVVGDAKGKVVLTRPKS